VPIETQFESPVKRPFAHPSSQATARR